VHAFGKVAKRVCFDLSGQAVTRPEVVTQVGLIAAMATGASHIPISVSDDARRVIFLSYNPHESTCNTVYSLDLDVNLKNARAGDLAIDASKVQAARAFLHQRRDADEVLQVSRLSLSESHLLPGAAETVAFVRVTRTLLDQIGGARTLIEVLENGDCPPIAIDACLDPSCLVLMFKVQQGNSGPEGFPAATSRVVVQVTKK
jgi:hypothetical protein